MVMYSRAKLPFMTDRENLIKMTSRRDGDKFSYQIRTVEHPDYPEKKGVIRMDIFKSSRVEV